MILICIAMTGNTASNNALGKKLKMINFVI